MRAYESVRESLQFNFQYFCISSVFVLYSAVGNVYSAVGNVHSPLRNVETALRNTHSPLRNIETPLRNIKRRYVCIKSIPPVLGNYDSYG